MVAIVTVQDMLETLDANPRLLEELRVRILTRELLELPKVVADLSDTVTGLSNVVADLSNVVVGLSASHKELTASHLRLETTLQKFMESTNARFDVIIQDIASMKGRHVEMDLQGKIYGILGNMRLSRARIVRAGYPAVASHKFCDKVFDSFENGVITGEQYRRVMNTDLIAKARRRGFAEAVYIAVEASNRLDRGDSDRADATKRALETVFPQSEVRAMVYGVDISDADRLHAESNGVDVLLER